MVLVNDCSSIFGEELVGASEKQEGQLSSGLAEAIDIWGCMGARCFNLYVTCESSIETDHEFALCSLIFSYVLGFKPNGLCSIPMPCQ